MMTSSQVLQGEAYCHRQEPTEDNQMAADRSAQHRAEATFCKGNHGAFSIGHLYTTISISMLFVIARKLTGYVCTMSRTISFSCTIEHDASRTYLRASIPLAKKLLLKRALLPTSQNPKSKGKAKQGIPYHHLKFLIDLDYSRIEGFEPVAQKALRVCSLSESWM